jgi:hypothetical protein
MAQVAKLSSALWVELKAIKICQDLSRFMVFGSSVWGMAGATGIIHESRFESEEAETKLRYGAFSEVYGAMICLKSIV